MACEHVAQVLGLVVATGGMAKQNIGTEGRGTTDPKVARAVAIEGAPRSARVRPSLCHIHEYLEKHLCIRRSATALLHRSCIRSL